MFFKNDIYYIQISKSKSYDISRLVKLVQIFSLVPFSIGSGVVGHSEEVGSEDVRSISLDFLFF